MINVQKKVLFISLTQGIHNRGAEYSTHLQADSLGSLGYEVTIAGNERNFYAGKYEYLDLCQLQLWYNFQVTNYLFKILNRLYLTPQTIGSVSFFFQLMRLNLCPNYIVVNDPVTLILSKFFYPKAIKISFGHAGVGFHTFDILRLKPNIFVSLSPDLKEYKKRTRGNTRLVYIPNGIDLSFFKPLKRVKKEIKDLVPKKRKVIFCAAALVPYKRVQNLIEAVSNIENCFLIIAGDGPLKQDLTKKADKLIGKQNYLVDTFDKEDMVHLYNLADVFVLPSEEKEAFGNVLIESMACNTPVVANDDRVRREIVGLKAGVLVDCSNPKYIRKGILSVLSNQYKDCPRLQAEKFSYLEIGRQISVSLSRIK